MPFNGSTDEDSNPQSSAPGSSSPSSRATELEVGERLPVRREGRLNVEKIRSDESLFTTVYADADTGEVRLAVQIDIRTGETAIDPRRFDRDFWTLVARDERHPATALERVLRQFRSPGIEVRPEAEEIHIYADGESPDNR